MPFYDITGTLEIDSSLGKDEITDELVRVFRAEKFSTLTQRRIDGNRVRIKTPFLLAVMRGARLRRVSDGIFILQKQEPEHYRLTYYLSIFPIRLLYIIMGFLPLIVFPVFFAFQGVPFSVENVLSDFRLLYPFASLFFYVIQRFLTQALFKRFLMRALKENAESTKYLSPKPNPETKRVFAVSCLTILLFILLVLGSLGISIIQARSKMLWRAPVGQTVMVGPAFEGDAIYFGSLPLEKEESAAFYALDSKTGSELWSVSIDGSVVERPTISENLVFFSTKNGSFYALDANNGQEVWRFEAEERNLNPDTCETCALQFNSPVVKDNIVYASSRDQNLYAFDRAGGKLKWLFETGDDITEAPVIVDDKIYFASLDGFIYVLDAKSGAEVGRYKIPAPESADRINFFSSPLVDTNSIYIANQTLMALDLETGELKWRFSPPTSDDPILFNSIIGNPFLLGDSVILVATDGVYGLDKITGELKWEFSRLKGRIYFAPALDENILYFGDSEWRLYALDAKNGRLRFKINMEYLNIFTRVQYEEPLFPPEANNGIVYISWEQSIYAIEGR